MIELLHYLFSSGGADKYPGDGLVTEAGDYYLFTEDNKVILEE